MTSLFIEQFSGKDKLLVHPKYRSDIDGLRAVAVLSVVIFHVFPTLFPAGFIGVDIFFVISGYLISTIILAGAREENFTFITFYKRRIKRIFPALILVITFCLAMGWICLIPPELKLLSKHIVGGSLFASNLILYNEAGYFDVSSEAKPLLHLWSLGIEEQFYIVWPLFLLLALRLRANISLVSALILASFLINVYFVHLNSAYAFYLPQSRAWELLIGALLADLSFRSIVFGAVCSNILSAIGSLLILAGFYCINSKSPFPGYWALIPTFGGAFIIAGGPESWINKKILSRRIMVVVGLISFPIYLWHWPLLSFARILSGGPLSFLCSLSVVIVTFILSYGTYQLVEKPVRYKVKEMPAVSVLLFLLLSLGLVGFAIYKNGGMPSRFPEEISEISNFQYDPAEGARVGKCWLTSSAPFDGFSDECFRPDIRPGSDSIFVWGDSHAGRLYTGINAVFGNSSLVLQATRDNCPPILNFKYDICIQSNLHTFEEIKIIKPGTVVLYAAWGRSGSDWEEGSEKRSKLLDTVHKLKEAGIKNVIVVGPSPEWKEQLPKIVYKKWKQDYPFHRMPDRISDGFIQDPVLIDSAFREFMVGSGAYFVSLQDLLCNADGCLVHVAGYPSKLLSWDYGHFTFYGATLVADHLRDIGLIESKN